MQNPKLLSSNFALKLKKKPYFDYNEYRKWTGLEKIIWYSNLIALRNFIE